MLSASASSADGSPSSAMAPSLITATLSQEMTSSSRWAMTTTAAWLRRDWISLRIRLSVCASLDHDGSGAGRRVRCGGSTGIGGGWKNILYTQWGSLMIGCSLPVTACKPASHQAQKTPNRTPKTRTTTKSVLRPNIQTNPRTKLFETLPPFSDPVSLERSHRIGIKLVVNRKLKYSEG